MRTIGIPITAIAVLTCVTVGVLPVAAADGDIDEAAPVKVEVAELHPAWQTWDATDPRLSGETTCREIRSETRDRGFRVRVHDWTVANADGSWSGVRYGIFSDESKGEAVFLILEGEGAYEGLTALLDWGAEPGASGISGVIVGADPPLPERAGQRH
jgi:hypothetical protein